MLASTRPNFDTRRSRLLSPVFHAPDQRPLVDVGHEIFSLSSASVWLRLLQRPPDQLELLTQRHPAQWSALLSDG
jgi:hypothetical protein